MNLCNLCDVMCVCVVTVIDLIYELVQHLFVNNLKFTQTVHEMM